jgi:hypothetical protein
LLTTLDIGIRNSLTHRPRLAESGKVTEDISGSSATSANSLLGGSDHCGIKRSGLSETGTDLAFEVAADVRCLTGILRAGRHADTLVGGGSGSGLGNGTLANILQELVVKLVTLRISSRKLGPALLGKLSSVLLCEIELSLSLLRGKRC